MVVMQEIISFFQVLKETEGADRQALLGNGFSQDWNSDIFNYRNLLESANFGIRDDAIKNVFKSLDTYDFEEVMHVMKASVVVTQSHGEYPAFVQSIENDANKIKTSLLTAIAETHPILPDRIADQQYVNARTFLGYFRNVFTLNYDLLMYWARNMRILEPLNFVSDDGFRDGGVWKGSETEKNIFFVHGSLHIYEDCGVVKKHTYTQNGATIIDKVRDNLDANKFPVFVAEPSSERKFQKIAHNPYLNFCFNKLEKIRGSLIIFGHSMDEVDCHIFKKISDSAVDDVYISVCGDPKSAANRKMMANAAGYFDCPIHYYAASSAGVWRGA